MEEKQTLGQKLADKITGFVGSWKFIILQTIILTIWVIINVENFIEFDPYPFILMNLFLSFQAAYATPMILMSGNRQSEKDREQTALDLKLDAEAHEMIKSIQKTLSDHELSKTKHEEILEKLDKILKKIEH